MKVAGIANDFLGFAGLSMLKNGGYNIVAPVLEADGKYYILKRQAEDIDALIDMTWYIDENLRDDWLKGFLERQEGAGKDVESIYNYEYFFDEYQPMFAGVDYLRKVDEYFHV